MAENFATVPAVWVLVFDRYPVDVASGESRETHESHRTGGLTPTARLSGERVKPYFFAPVAFSSVGLMRS